MNNLYGVLETNSNHMLYYLQNILLYIIFNVKSIMFLRKNKKNLRNLKYFQIKNVDSLI